MLIIGVTPSDKQYEELKELAGEFEAYGCKVEMRRNSISPFDKNKTVIASFGSPYVYRYYENSNLTYINAYHNSKEVIKAFVSALFGENPFTGRSSVELI